MMKIRLCRSFVIKFFHCTVLVYGYKIICVYPLPFTLAFAKIYPGYPEAFFRVSPFGFGSCPSNSLIRCSFSAKVLSNNSMYLVL